MDFPSPAGDYEEKRLSLDDLCVLHPVSTFFMRVSGDAMIGVCISFTRNNQISIFFVY
jgi:DNA polymerase V